MAARSRDAGAAVPSAQIGPQSFYPLDELWQTRADDEAAGHIQSRGRWTGRMADYRQQHRFVLTDFRAIGMPEADIAPRAGLQRRHEDAERLDALVKTVSGEQCVQFRAAAFACGSLTRPYPHGPQHDGAAAVEVRDRPIDEIVHQDGPPLAWPCKEDLASHPAASRRARRAHGGNAALAAISGPLRQPGAWAVGNIVIAITLSPANANELQLNGVRLGCQVTRGNSGEYYDEWRLPCKGTPARQSPLPAQKRR